MVFNLFVVVNPTSNWLVLLISFGPWALNRLTNCVKSQMDDLAAKPIQVYYHTLAMEVQENQDEVVISSRVFPKVISSQPKKGNFHPMTKYKRAIQNPL